MLASTAIGVVPPQRSGMASGISSTFRQVGIATGIAALGAIFERQITNKLIVSLAGTPGAAHTSQIAHAVAAGGAQQVVTQIPPTARSRVVEAVHAAFASALNDILLVGGIIAFAGAVLCFLLVRERDFVPSGAPPSTAPEPVHVATTAG